MLEFSGPVIMDIAGTAVDGEERELLSHPAVGGIILFSRNYTDPGQLRALCAELKNFPRPIPLVITVDHEGGRVQRFRDGFTALPAAATCGRRYMDDPDSAVTAARAQGATLAFELKEQGIDLSFAPVLDLDRGLGSVIGDRAFSADPEVVSILGRAWIEGMHAHAMPACGKHFPGHGGVAGDSHHELPVDPRPLNAILAQDVVPFRDAIDAGLDSIMMAHVLYPDVDSVPASMSYRWVTEILRQRLGFRGTVYCDDLSMAGAAGFGSYPDRARAALTAGCDILPVCNHRAGVIAILDDLPHR